MRTNHDLIATRGRALEEEHFRRLEAERITRFREGRRLDALRRELGTELDVEDEALLDRLIDLGVTPETAPAFEALPLLEVAWADGEVDPEERWQALTAATSFGLELGGSAHARLERWVMERPRAELFAAWYVVQASRSSGSRSGPRARCMLERALEVAEASGGVLGFRPVSRAEAAVIERIRAVLGAGSEPSVPS